MVHRRAARFVKGRYGMFESVTQMLEQLTWAPLSKRRENSCLILFYKIINNLAVVPHSCLEKADVRTRKKLSQKFRHIGYNIDPYGQSFFPNCIIIAISSLLCKVFDIIILDSQSKSLGTDVLQFGFKKSSSTVICTSLMLETIDYYVENNTDCYLLLLDASKAFDRVGYVKLFTILRDRKLCPIVLRLLMNMYINQTIQVRWNNTLSNMCGISNGVKQGGCLSPTLFSLYINDLINILRQNNIGCRYGPHYMGVYGYADDISLLCPTVSGMKEMLKTCETFAEQHAILFNASKSQVLWFGKGIKPKHISLKMENG